jgi:hypothetical protein
MESWRHFEKRVLEVTGWRLNDMPVLTEMPAAGGAIMARRGDLLVVSLGYETDFGSANGAGVWASFAQLTLTHDCENHNVSAPPCPDCGAWK